MDMSFDRISRVWNDVEICAESDGAFCDSFLASKLVQLTEARPASGVTVEPPELDFLSLITAISRAYTSGQYMSILSLNRVETKQRVGRRTDHVICINKVPPKLYDQRRQTALALENRFAVKNLDQITTSRSRMRPYEYTIFIRELDILYHFHDNERIVSLRGVGFFHQLDEVNLQPSPRATLIYEPPDETLQSLIDERRDLLDFALETRICHDVALGLQALHETGIAHGDIKPANIFIFRAREGTGTAARDVYRAKIADFSKSRWTLDKSQGPIGGTKAYTSPEADNILTSQDVMLSDTWSLGVLFAVVMLENDDFLEEPTPSTVAQHILSLFEERIHRKNWGRKKTEFIRSLFRLTLKDNPKARSLTLVLKAFSIYGETHTPAPKHNSQRPFEPISNKDLFVSYEHLKHASGQVKDVLLSSLEREANDRSSPRQAMAACELAILLLSRFVAPGENDEAGLRYLSLAAQLGNLKAQGLAFGFRSVFSSTSLRLDSDPNSLRWLLDAARSGHSMALHDLNSLILSNLIETDNDSLDAKRAGLKHLVHTTQSLFVQPDICDDDSSNTTLSAIAEAISEGNWTTFRNLLNFSSNLNERSVGGDTPLITAARLGHATVVYDLLKAGADATIQNNEGANFLHFACCFDETLTVVKQIFSFWRDSESAQVIFYQRARRVQTNPSLDFFSTPGGTPLERAAGRNRDNLVQLFLENMPDLLPSNCAVLRQALLLAFRFHNFKVQKLILDYIKAKPALSNYSQSPISYTSWDYKGKKNHFLDAIVIGPVSGLPGVPDLPKNLWRIVCHGRNAETAIIQSIENCLDMMLTDGMDFENYLDDAIRLSIEERDSEVLKHLLIKKADITDGERNRLSSLRQLIWRSSPSPAAIDMLQKPGIGELLREDYHNAYTIMERFYGFSDNGLYSMPPKSINYVDQIFHDKGTLAQQAIIGGDRSTFHLFVHEFSADLTLPYSREITWSRFHQMNSFALMAYADHFDPWFANELLLNHIYPSYPLPRRPQTASNIDGHARYDILTHLQHEENNKIDIVQWLAKNESMILSAQPMVSLFIQATINPDTLLEQDLPWLLSESTLATTGINRDTLFFWIAKSLCTGEASEDDGTDFIESIIRSTETAFLLFEGDQFSWTTPCSSSNRLERWRTFLRSNPPARLKPPKDKQWFRLRFPRPGESLFGICARHPGLLAETVDHFENSMDPFPRQPMSELIMGSCMDELPLVSIVGSRLFYIHGYFPSIWHSGIRSLLIGSIVYSSLLAWQITQLPRLRSGHGPRAILIFLIVLSSIAILVLALTSIIQLGSTRVTTRWLWFVHACMFGVQIILTVLMFIVWIIAKAISLIPKVDAIWPWEAFPLTRVD